jgi:2-haloacid dehalogenase
MLRAILIPHVRSVPMLIDEVKALVFDVFGTVVDWRSSIIREGKELGKRKGITHVDWAEFADAWRGGYGPSMNKVRTGEMPWTRIDDLHRMVLDELLTKYGIEGLTEDEKRRFNTAWHRLDPWPDSPPGLTRLKKRYIIATLSNGNVALLTNMAKFGGLPWDCILSAELARHYKPDPETYLMAADILGLEPSEVMMTAAHKGDLKAARAQGMKTAFVPRPFERGPRADIDTSVEDWIDVAASDFEELALKMGT